MHWHNLFRAHRVWERQDRWTPLDPLGEVYGEVMRVRNFLYDRGWFKTRWLNAPVISVGNLTTGGTGKTPTVIFLSKLAAELGFNPGVILRGYGSGRTEESDEVKLLRRNLPGVPIAAGADRIAGGRKTLDQSANLIVADDAFQHRRLGRDLDVLLVDAGFAFGGGKILPAGRLREPVDSLNRADVVIVTRSDQVDEPVLEQIRRRVRTWAGEIPILLSRHRVTRCVDLAGRTDVSLSGRTVLAFAGIARPEAFVRTLQSLGAQVAATKTFRDHHQFSARDMKTIREAMDRSGAEVAVCTEKDLVRIEPELAKAAGLDPARLVAVEIEIEMDEGDRKILAEKIHNAGQIAKIAKDHAVD